MRKRAAMAMGILAVWMACLPARAIVDVPADDPSIQYYGRFDFTNPKKPRCDWPGTSIQARFTGTTITVKISGGANDFNVIVDGVWKSKLTVDGKTSQVAAEGLAEGTHTLVLSKRTEGFNGISTFEGFQLPDGKAMAAPPARPAHRIQYIGDSFTVGYGDEANVLSCPDRRPFDNNYVAYGPIAARALDAEYSVQAVSGIGMVHNNSDPSQISARPMPSYFENTLFGADAPKWDMAKWIPEVIVIALGTNDFSTAVKPTQAQYATAYKDFLKKIRAWYPSAQILCLTYAVDNYQKAYVDTIVAEAAAAGDAKIHRTHMPTLNAATDLGCDYHPNVSGQQKYADALIPILRPYLSATSTRAPGGKASGLKRKAAPAAPAPGETWRVPYRIPDGTEWVDAGGKALPL